MPEKPEYEVDIITLVYGGDAMGRLPDGRAVFVPSALPGERVRVQLTEQKRGFARGRLLEVLRPSADRIAPRCEHYGACGGCHYMHMTYPAQLRAKTAIVRDQLSRIAGVPEPPVAEIVPSSREWGYRNTVQFHLTPDGKPGFQETGSHVVVPIVECPLCEPAVDEVWPLIDFEPGSGVERVQLRAGLDDEVMMVLESNDPVPPEMSVEQPLSVVFVGPGGFEENAPLVLAGEEALTMRAAGRDFQVSAGSFFQVNTPQAEAMLGYLLEQLPLGPAVRAAEIYAGVGFFSAAIAPRVSSLTAVEASPSATGDFAANLDEFDNVSLYEGLAEQVLPGLDLHADVVLVDPPRAGIALPALDALIAVGAPLLAYVSCDPATMARDARRLLAAGYRLRSVQPFDMFPQTYHIESISIFERPR